MAEWHSRVEVGSYKNGEILSVKATSGSRFGGVWRVHSLHLSPGISKIVSPHCVYGSASPEVS